MRLNNFDRQFMTRFLNRAPEVFVEKLKLSEAFLDAEIVNVFYTGKNNFFNLENNRQESRGSERT